MNYEALNEKLPFPLNYTTTAIYLCFNLYVCYFIANHYLVSAMSKIIQEMKWCSDIAGILLLNIGNGIPDLVTSIILLDEQPHIIIATSLGTVIFTLTIGLAMIILNSKKTNHIDFGVYYKNLFMLITTFSFYIYLLATQILSIVAPVLMLFLYVSFILYSLYFSKAYNDTVEVITINEETQKNFLKKFLDFIKAPIKIILNICTLYDDKVFKIIKFHAFISPTMNFMIFYIYNGLQMTFQNFVSIFILCLVIGTIFCAILSKNTAKIVITIYSFMICCLHTYLLTNEIVNYISFQSEKLKISKSISSLLFLSFGNSIGDLITGIATTRKGLFKTAANACLVSPVHNTLFNLGIIFLVMLSRNGFESVFIVYDSVVNVAMCMGPFIFLNLILNYEIRNKKLECELAYVLIFMYVVFFVFTVLQLV